MIRPKWNTNSDEERGKEVAKRKLTEEQIVECGEAAGGGPDSSGNGPEVGVSTYTIYSWKAKYGGVEPNEAARLHHLEDENSRLKRLVAELSLDRRC